MHPNMRQFTAFYFTLSVSNVTATKAYKCRKSYCLTVFYHNTGTYTSKLLCI